MTPSRKSAILLSAILMLSTAKTIEASCSNRLKLAGIALLGSVGVITWMHLNPSNHQKAVTAPTSENPHPRPSLNKSPSGPARAQLSAAERAFLENKRLLQVDWPEADPALLDKYAKVMKPQSVRLEAALIKLNKYLEILKNPPKDPIKLVMLLDENKFERIPYNGYDLGSEFEPNFSVSYTDKNGKVFSNNGYRPVTIDENSLGFDAEGNFLQPQKGEIHLDTLDVAFEGLLPSERNSLMLQRGGEMTLTSLQAISNIDKLSQEDRSQLNIINEGSDIPGRPAIYKKLADLSQEEKEKLRSHEDIFNPLLDLAGPGLNWQFETISNPRRLGPDANKIYFQYASMVGEYNATLEDAVNRRDFETAEVMLKLIQDTWELQQASGTVTPIFTHRWEDRGEGFRLYPNRAWQRNFTPNLINP